MHTGSGDLDCCWFHACSSENEAETLRRLLNSRGLLVVRSGRDIVGLVGERERARELIADHPPHRVGVFARVRGWLTRGTVSETR